MFGLGKGLLDVWWTSFVGTTETARQESHTSLSTNFLWLWIGLEQALVKNLEVFSKAIITNTKSGPQVPQHTTFLLRRKTKLRLVECCDLVEGVLKRCLWLH